MEAKEIIEGNKLIAEFMGGKLIPFPDSVYKEVYEFETEITYCSGKKWPIPVLAYHVSWDWLMPVVEKIKTIKHPDYYGFGFSMINDTIQFTADNLIVPQFKKHWKEKDSMLNATWLAVVEFLEWYNQNKTI